MTRAAHGEACECERCAYADGYAEGREEADSLATQLEQMRRERDEARARLARIRDVTMDRYDTATTACDALRAVLHIIDEKEGGQ